MKLKFNPLLAKLSALAFLATAGVAHAALDADSKAAIATSKADVVELGGAVFAVILAIKTVHWIRRAM